MTTKRVMAAFDGELRTRFQPGMTISVGGTVIGQIEELTYHPPDEPPQEELDGVLISDEGWTSLTFSIGPCEKCRRTDGWRRTLFWRRWHKRTCAHHKFLTDLENGVYSSVSVGAQALRMEEDS